ncbi:hypothetical protein E2I00_018384 [Balaenoptera physalus]|uniref:Fringe-like glycosyltransferase domain-containing protein n=1 Tax=Balaenoptera physalus TaxID=9770 RepID=A0A6A1Q9N4_BALPH|nr:hypothetical protein E2I00_018384 [Balaenoptera physalus]
MDILRCRGKRGYEAFLEALEFYYPEHFTLLTGQEPAQRCSMILDEEGPEGLTQFLMTEVRRLREARKSQLQREQQLQARGRVLEEERAGLEQRLREQQQAQERCQRLREDWEAGSLELLRLKDENYMIAMRLAQLSEEKNSAVLRSRDLQLAEASRPGAPGSERILLDILEHDWREAQDSRQELCQKLHAVQGELQWAEELRDKYLQEMEDLRLKHRTLQKDCDLYKHRMATVLAQLEEIEKERDQYRKQVRGLEAERDELLTALTSLEGAKALLEVQLQRVQGGPYLKACASSHSLCSNLSSTWSLSEFPSPLGGPETAGEAAVTGGSEPHTSEEATDSEKEINRLSILPFPPSAGSILRRQREEDPAPPKRSFSSMSDITGSVTLKPWSPGLSSSSSSDSVWPLGKPEGLLARGCGLDLLNRSLAIRVSGWSPPGGPEPQDKGLDGLSFLGDSWSGAVVRRVLSGPGSARVEPRELKKRALDQLRLVKPKHVGSPAGDSPEQLLLEPCSEPERSLKPYSLVRPLLVSALRPVVLLPECLAPRLIRNLLDLPSSRLDFQVCPAGSHLVVTNCSAEHSHPALSCKMAAEFDAFLASGLSGPRFVDTSALIRLPDDCTVGYIVECKLGGHLQPSPLFHSHLETLQLLGAAQLPEQVTLSYGVFEGKLNVIKLHGPFSPEEDSSRPREHLFSSDTAVLSLLPVLRKHPEKGEADLDQKLAPA